MQVPVKPGERGAVPLAAIIVVGVVALLLGGYALIGAMADYMAARVPDKTEADMFGAIGARQSQWKAEGATEEEKRVFLVFDKLIKGAGPMRELNYAAYVMPEKSPNAFALPGGNVAVTEGLVKLVKSDIGMALVLGHELGHDQFRHGMKMLGRRLAYALILSFVMGGDGMAGTALDAAANAHSRDQELEADAFGMRLVHKVFGTTAGALEFFEKVETDPALAEHKGGSILSTHPFTGDRIARMKRIAAELDKEFPPPPAAPKAAPPAAPKAKKKARKR